MQCCPDITPTRQVPGWEPKVKPEDGLRRTIVYFDALLTRL